MMGGLIPDEDLARRLPLPLAQLYRRAHNAKTPLDRHNAAYCLWEAALKLLGSVAIVAHAERGAVAPELAERLQNLARPALGHWWEFVRLLVPPLAEAGDEGFRQVRELVLGRQRDDLPRAAGLDAALREAIDGTTGGRVTVELSDLFKRMVRYRNQELGHGAPGQRDAAFYDRMGKGILLGVGEILARLNVLAGRRLLYVADVRRQASGDWLVERYELAGEVFRRLESMERPESEASVLPRPGRLYLDAPGDPGPPSGWSLHPLVLVEFKTAEVFFLNSRRGRRRTEYLGYHPGRVVERMDLGDEQRALLSRVLGMEVDPAQAERWAANSQAEEPPLPPSAAAEAPRRRLGEFELLSELGRGGMGVVYRAWQPSLGRQVALKCLLKAGDPKADARFNREIHALGRVEHPNLVKVFTSGVEAERWFYAMELVQGANLAAVCGQLRTAGSGASDVDLTIWHASLSTACQAARQSERPLSNHGDDDSHSEDRPARAAPLPPQTGDRGYVLHMVELVRQVADAAHALHEAGVIHRDIKPENILVGPDGSEAVLMDLGLAQLADESEGRLTRTRQFVGTLRYASPEQVLSVPLDRRSDIYSLGATLWELLTLRPLFGATEQMPTPDLMLMIQHTDPESPRRFNPQVPADLEAILLKCLEKDRARRYATASDLAADLSRWMRGEPVQAQPPTLGYLLSKALRRHRGRVALAASLLLALLLGTAAALTFQANRRILRAREIAEEAKADAEVSRNQAVVARDGEAESRAKIESLKEVLRLRLVESTDILNGDEEIKRGDPISSLPWYADALRLELGEPRRERANRIRLAMALQRCPKLTQVLFPGGEVGHAEFSADGDRIFIASSGRRALVWDAATGQPITPPTQHKSDDDPFDKAMMALDAAFSPDGRRVLTTNPNNTARVWDTATGKPTAPPMKHAAILLHAEFSPDARYVVTASADHTARVWDASSAQPITPPLDHKSSVVHATFSPDRRRVVTASLDNTARIWDADTGELITPPLKHENTVIRAAFSPDGRRVLTASYDNTARVWDANTGEPITPPLKHENSVFRAAFSPDGRRVLTASWDRTARVWDATTGEPASPPMKHAGRVNTAAFSPDGRHVLTSSDDQSSRLWDATTGEPISPPATHTKAVTHAAFSPDGRHVLTACKDGIIRIWDTAALPTIAPPLAHELGVAYAAFSSDGLRILTSGWDDTARVWDVSTGQPITQPMTHQALVYHAEFSPDSRRVLTTSDDKTAQVWDAATGEPISAPMKHQDGVYKATFSPDGRLILTTTDKAARVWDAATGAPMAPPFKHAGDVIHAAFSPDSRRVITASDDKAARVWDAATGAPLSVPMKHQGGLNDAAFSPDGRLIVTASSDETARLWDAATGAPTAPPLKHETNVFHAEFSRDGRHVLTASIDGTLHLWDAASGVPTALPLNHKAGLDHAEFSGDGRLVLTIDNENSARVWDATSGEPVSPPLSHGSYVNHVELSPDGRRVLTASEDKTARVWDVTTGQPVSIPLSHEDSVLHATFSPSGERVVTASKDMTAKVWDLRADDRATNALLLLAECLSGSRIETRGALVPLTQEEFHERFQALSEKFPAELAASKQEVLAWHLREAEGCEAKAVWRSAVTHLDALIALSPGDRMLYMRRGDAYAEQAQWDRASADFSKAVETQPADLERFHLTRRLAYVALAANDMAAYRRACASLLDLHGRLTDSKDTAVFLTFACALAPDAVADREAMVRLAQKAVQAAKPDDDRHNLLSTLGAVTHRAGRSDEAVKQLDEALKAETLEGDALDWLFLALAQERLGHSGEARKWLDKATAWIDSSTKDKPNDESLGIRIDWQTWLGVQVLRREAECSGQAVRLPPPRPFSRASEAVPESPS